MAFPNLPNSRTLVDATLVQSLALPAASGTAYTGSIDLGVAPYSASEHYTVSVSVPALPLLTSTNDSYTFSLQHSSDNATWTAIPGLTGIALVGIASTGTPATSEVFKLPPATLEYIRGEAVATSGTGNSTALSFTLELLF